ncbi:MAG: hypothetical protein J07AB43_01120 [Candidatus Nanosalina sp. J07AB43]|nr:MAG: hypothetical protein J07AB43_01120 [Candidatus Nanosalina sp. J07AB43]
MNSEQYTDSITEKVLEDLSDAQTNEEILQALQGLYTERQSPENRALIVAAGNMIEKNISHEHGR